MRLGICGSPSKGRQIADLGCDYLEWPVSAALGNSTEDDIRALVRTVEELPIKPEAWNVLFPGTIKLVGPTVDKKEITDYLESVLPQVSRLGGEVVVLGSGRSRRVPEDFTREQAVEQFLEVCCLAGDIAGECGLKIALEPLNERECNLLNTVLAGTEMVEKLNHDHVGVLADLYHMEMVGEPFSSIERAGKKLLHVHIAVSEQRVMPGPSQGGDLLGAFFAALKNAGYTERVSVEGVWDTPQAPSQLQWLRETWG